MQQLTAHNIQHAFGKKPILQDVSLNLNVGQITALFGRNGSGKTTLLNILFGILKNASFQITVDGKRIKQKKIIPQQIIGYLPQYHFLPKNLTVRQIIPLFFKDGELQDVIFYSKGVSAFEKKKIGQLSIGQRKYLEVLLVAHLSHPFLLLDEPFTMVEPLYKEEIKNILVNIKRYKGILITDHYYHDVLSIANRIYLLKEGLMKNVSSEKELQELEYLKTV